MTSVTRLGEKLVLWRTKENEIICLKDKCAHRGAALSGGQLCRGSETVECPFHGLQYDASGKCVVIPANGKNAIVPEQFKVHSYPIREAHDFIWMWWGDLKEDYPPLPFFNDIDKEFSYKTYTETWPVHYSRAIENQLDVVHLPFVHYNTIGRGHRTLVHGPLVEEMKDKSGFRVWVYNEKDDGEKKPYTPEEFPEEFKTFYIQFKFPHLWENNIGNSVRVFLAFVPIDEEHTLFYMRFYQKVVRMPLLKNLISWFGVKSSIIILHQDKSVVITQQPIKTALKMGEKLIQGDSPILFYRKRRQELLDLSSK